MKSSSKYQCCGITCAIIGVVLLSLGIAFFAIVEGLLVSGSKKEAALVPDTYQQWANIPGIYDLLLMRNLYLYNCTNYEDVLYKGEQPKFEEWGPYYYREFDSFSENTYDHDLTIPGSDDPSNTRKAVNGSFTVTTELYEPYADKMDAGLDQPIYQINQAAQGAWYTAQNTAYWRTAITILYSLFWDGLGRQLIESSAWTLMATVNFRKNVNRLFDGTTPPEQAILDAMYSDEYYGLKHLDNYGKYDQLMDYMSPLQKRLFKNELMLYFGLTNAQANAVEVNWNSIYNSAAESFLTYDGSTYPGLQELAYWQWANSASTNTVATKFAPSVVNVSDTAVGYPEVNFFKNYYFNYKVGDANKAQFQNVKLYVDDQNPTVNYEYLFNLTNGNGDVPDENSLFNVQTLKQLCNLGLQIVDITLPDHKDDTLAFSPEWDSLTQKLGLAQNEQTYLLWLWMKYAIDFVGNREQDGGNAQVAMLSQLGAIGINQTIGTMECEFPIIIHAYQFALAYQQTGQTCAQFYAQYGFTDSAWTDKICNNSLFNFVDAVQTSHALMNIFFLNNTYPYTKYYADYFYGLEGVPANAIDSFFFDDASTFNTFVQQNVMTALKTKYSTVCTGNPSSYCSFRQLVFNQWAFGSILTDPLSNFPKNIDPTSKPYISYTRFFPKYMTSLSFTPEISYYLMRAEQPQLQVTPDNVWLYLNISRLFNLKPIQDIILNTDPNNPFNNDQTRLYISFITLEKSLFGMFYKKTPREYIEGYDDPLVYSLSLTPVYLAGDATNPVRMGLNEDPLNPPNNPVYFFQGDDDYMQTRAYARWLDRDYITIQRKDYTNIRDLETVYVEPYNERIYLTGTDGNQVHPILDDDNVGGIEIFVSDLSRAGTFNLKNVTYQYDGLKLYYVEIAKDLMYNSTYNPANAKYNVRINGTSNLSTSMMAPVFASKGHYYQISTDLGNTLPKLYNHQGEEIQPDPENDDTFLGIEAYSGMTLFARQRIMMNFYVAKDLLFNFLKQDYIIPLAFIQKEATLDQDQVNDYLGDIYTAQSMVVPLSVVFSILGAAMIILAIYLICRSKKIRIQEENKEKFGIGTKEEYKKLNETSFENSQVTVSPDRNNNGNNLF